MPLSRARPALLGLACLLATAAAGAQPRHHPRAFVQALMEQGHALRLRGTEESLRQAIEAYARALPLWTAAGDAGGRGAALFYIGMCRSALGDKPGALELYLEALPLRRAAGDRTGEAQTLNNIGVVYDYLGEDQKALASYRDSLAHKRELADTLGQATTLANIGLIYAGMGEHEEALAYYDQALLLRRRAGDQAGLGPLLHNIGRVLAARGEPEQALRRYQESLAARRRMGDRRGEAYTLTSLGALEGELGRPGALRTLEQALAITGETGDRLARALVLHDMGALHEARGETSAALAAYRAALEIRRAVAHRGGEAVTLASLARLERDRGELDAAWGHAQAALAVVEALREKLAVPDVRASFLASREGYYDFAIDLLMRLHERDPSAGHDRAAFEMSERARARSLLEALREAGHEIREGADAELLRREQALRWRIRTVERQRTQALAGRGGEARRAERELAQLLAEADELEAQIRVQSPRYAALTRPEPLSLEQIQHGLLDERTVLLQFALGERRSFLWLVAPGRFATYELPPQARIDDAAERCHRLLIGSRQRLQRAAAERAAGELGALLLHPAAGELAGKRLLIVGDGQLQKVPWAAVRAPRPLLEDHEIVVLPSASVAVLLRRLEDRPPAPRPLALLADPVLSADDPRLPRPAPAASVPGLPRLRFARREAEAIARRAGHPQALTALGFEATRELALGGELARYRVVHFATHGWMDDRHPALSALALSMFGRDGRPRDGRLRLYDVYNLRLEADLVVLSACETALGRQVQGEGLMSLVRGFMYAGAPRVVASLWKVGDEATAELMARFYRALLSEGASPAAALRAAQLALRSDPRWRAPYYWAGFTLQGEWKAPRALPLSPAAGPPAGRSAPRSRAPSGARRTEAPPTRWRPS